MAEAVRKAAAGAGGVPAALLFGTVTAAEPLKVLVESRFELRREQLVLMRGAACEKGDALVLLRDHGGQRFLVLGVM